MPIDSSTTVTITCDHCGKEINPPADVVFRLRAIVEGGDGGTFRVIKDATVVLCETDAQAAQAWLKPTA